ncbi:msl1391 [Mesorhizobium japonicum MAFF 303099]|uniref:Msl1391 protein n=1 Tax=Mesorhizobium japonicum (strain LMG 29417 / CECT 9101 / MAFF 303099) TaxID=266835 RepID=Q98KN7_RHILO|nr:msl1391 [Mesorhizobium japonicum MAFF 303099]
MRTHQIPRRLGGKTLKARCVWRVSSHGRDRDDRANAAAFPAMRQQKHPKERLDAGLSIGHEDIQSLMGQILHAAARIADL